MKCPHVYEVLATTAALGTVGYVVGKLANTRVRKVHFIVCGDIGGTNSRLRLIRLSHQEHIQPEVLGHAPPGNVVLDCNFLNQEFATFEAVVRAFLAKTSSATSVISAACFAVAGPVDPNRNYCEFTNRDWIIDGPALQASLGITRIRLINDFVANGYGLLTLNVSEGSTDVETLNKGNYVEGAPIACVGAGTGFGQTYLTRPVGSAAGTPYDAFPSEGGHTEFAPRTALEVEVLEHMKQQYLQRGLKINHRISAERIVSGKGIKAVYEFLKTKWPHEVRKDVEDEMAALGDNASAAIAKYGDPRGLGSGRSSQDGQNRRESGEGKATCWLCQTTMEIFWSTYGSEAGSASLKWLPYSGMYIAGGIAQKNVEWMKWQRASSKTAGHTWGFLPAYFDKGRLTMEVRKVPLHVVLVPDLGQRGAQLVALRELRAVA